MAALPQNFHHERTERPRDNFVAVRIVESNSVDNVAVALQREKFFARIRVPHLHHAVVNFSTFSHAAIVSPNNRAPSSPHLAGTVVTPSDELVARLVEGAVRQWQDVRSQNLEQIKIATLVALKLLNELCADAGAGDIRGAIDRRTMAFDR
jgi:hypothetical protein